MRILDYLVDVAPAIRNGLLYVVRSEIRISNETPYQLTDADVERMKSMGFKRSD